MWDTVPADNVPDERPAGHERSSGGRTPTAGNFVYYDPWEVTDTSCAHALALREIPRSVPNGHPVWFMFSNDWHESYDDDPMVHDESEKAGATTAPVTAMVGDVDKAEPHMVAPDDWNMADSAEASPSTATPVS